MGICLCCWFTGALSLGKRNSWVCASSAGKEEESDWVGSASATKCLGVVHCSQSCSLGILYGERDHAWRRWGPNPACRSRNFCRMADVSFCFLSNMESANHL